ncbi:hypothetical protein GPECTOR_39g450 [Gonium pectorale]|uniref:Uncharacterized protein n=1 Tax=Gonium pectorale TaxID=33097 RepID=A0A150GAT0_GONPE|nr:hypothetical protein GPECTOR_39g450 [Gonium pectorale]|eukprot:KXZ46956.1 hypothetical protein GPECTOR_39g450 [Gonium pectorale]
MAQVADPAGLLGAAVGYVWARLCLQTPLSGPLAAASGPALAEALAEAAVAGSGGAWHPARGTLAALLGGSLGMARLLDMAAAGARPAAAAELLEAHTAGPLFGDTQLLARALLEAARKSLAAAAPPPPRTSSLAAHLVQDTAAATRRLHQLYGAVADSAGGRTWLAALPPAAAGALRDMLDRSFVCAVSVLLTATDALELPQPPSTAAPAPAAAAAADEAAMAVRALGALADLQFCAVQVRAYGDLVARLNAAVAAAPAAAVQPLISLLPCYPALAAAYGGAPAVAISRLAFLLPLAASCLPHAPHFEVAAAAVLPYVYLLLKGAPEQVTQAAHAVWAATLARLCEREGDGEVREPGSGGGGAAGGQSAALVAPAHRSAGGSAAAVEVAASMVPYYMERTCSPPCSAGDVELMEKGLRQAVRSLPGGHPVKAWAVRCLAQQLAAWMGNAPAAAAAPGTAPASPPAAAAAAAGAGPPHAGSPLAPHPGPAASPAAGPTQRAAGALGTLAAELDFPLLPHALAALDELVLGLGHDGRTVVLQELYESWMQCNDYARKPLLDEWLRRAVAAPLAAAAQGRLGWADLRAGAPSGTRGAATWGAPATRLQVRLV